MKKQIRNNVFETNSSSQHSLVISEDGLEPSEFTLDENGYIHVGYGSFGKEYEIYTTQYDKLSYLITLCYYCTNPHQNTENTYQFKYIEDAIRSYIGNECKGIIIDEEYEPYIDHQSYPCDGDIEIVNVYDINSINNFVFNEYISLKTESD